jgi:hypothetical protein
MKCKFFLPQLFCLCLLLSFGWTGCDIINPDETLPTTIHLDPFEFEVLPGQGSANNKITEVWVFANESFLGVFALPVDVYYLGIGQTTFSLRPGIRNNGIASDAITYPMFEGYTQLLEASPGASFSLQPVAGYKDQTVFGFTTDFELDNPFTDNRDTISASELVRSDTDVFEGQFAGEMIMSEEAYFIEVGHAVPVVLPYDGSPVYLEFRYKSEVPFSIGLLGVELSGTTASHFFYIVNSSDEWNMLYIELTDQVGLSEFDAYKILFRSIYPADSPTDELHIFLDNIKVVYLPL